MARISNPEVAAVFRSYPPKPRKRLLEVRELILETAREIDGVGRIEEALRWGEPAFLTTRTGSGTTIRVHWKEATPNQFRVHFHCQTSLIKSFRARFRGILNFEGNRSIVFEEDEPLPRAELSACFAQALTYHQNKKRRARRQP